MLPTRYVQYPLAPVGSDRQIPGYPYGMRGMAGPQGFGAPLMIDERTGQPISMPNYPPAPIPQGLPAQSYFQLPPTFQHTMGYKDALAAAGLEFHTEIFDLSVDPIAQSGQNLAAGATVIATVRISQEADFVCEKIMDWTVDSADRVLPELVGWRLQIFDNATNRALSNIPVPRSSIAGTAQRPALWKPRLFRRNSDLSFVFTADAGNDNPITQLVVTMQGFKIFDPNALNLNNPQ